MAGDEERRNHESPESAAPAGPATTSPGGGNGVSPDSLTSPLDPLRGLCAAVSIRREDEG